MAAPPPSALARPLRRARFLPVGGLCPPRPHPGGASAARRSGPPARPGFSFCGGRSPPRPRRSGARGADSRAAARSVRGRLRPSRSPPVRCPRRGFEGSRAFCPGEAAALTLPAGPVPAARVRGQPRVLSGGGCAPHAPVGHGARGADSRAAARSVRGRQSPPRPRRSGARGADSRAAARSVRGRLRPPRPRRARRTRRGFEGSRAFCPWEAKPPTPPSGTAHTARIRGQPRVLSVGGKAPHAPVGHGARGADSRAAARSVRGRPRSSRFPSGTAHAARIRGQPRVLSGAGRAPRAPRRARRTRRGFEGSRAFCPGEAAALTLPAGHGARGADSRAAAPSVRGRLRPSRSPPVRCPRRGFEGSRAFCPGEAAALTLPAGPVPAARIRGQPRVLSGGGCAPHAPRRSGARGAGSRGARPPFSARERATVMVRPLQN